MPEAWRGGSLGLGAPPMRKASLPRGCGVGPDESTELLVLKSSLRGSLRVPVGAISEPLEVGVVLRERKGPQ